MPERSKSVKNESPSHMAGCQKLLTGHTMVAAVDCLGKGAWGCAGVGAAKGVFDRCGMISGRFQGMGHCTHVRNDFREFEG